MVKSRTLALLGMLSILAASGYGRNAVAQLNFMGRPNYGTVTLRPGFLPDPRSVSVVSGGGMAAQVAGANCRGWITPQPDVSLILLGMSPWFRVYVTSNSDTTLVVRRPDGLVMCADDTFGLNPAVEGTFIPGRYSIWVGSYRSGENAPAIVSFTELPANRP